VATSSSGEQAFLAAEGGSVTLRVWVVPGAHRTETAGVRDGYLRIRLAAPAREGLANDELRRFVAGRAGVPRNDVAIIAGKNSRRKVLRVAGADASALEVALCPST
jgi:uncharacterized protein (TIGR00251 family)